MKKVFKKLYQKSSDGKIKHWQIEVEEVNNTGVMNAKYGKEDSKIRIDARIIAEGKNVGKANETTPYEQAISEAESKFNKKIDKGYVEDLKDLDIEVLRPMLAHNFTKRGHNIVYPCFVQPKLDGVRCLAKKVDEKTIKYYSRMGKEFVTLEHLTPDLLKMLKVGEVLDGEIYSHDITFQELIRLVKKLRPESVNLEYHVYDLVDDKLLFMNRNEEVIKKIPHEGKIIYVKTKLISCLDDIKFMQRRYTEDGYEGTIIRNKEGSYKLNGRSADLQKYKEFQDEEFEIVGGKPGTGSDAGCVVFRVKNDKNEFSVRPRGTMEQRTKWMDNINSIVGKKLTVRFQEKTDGGVPRFPVGISIRNYE